MKSPHIAFFRSSTRSIYNGTESLLFKETAQRCDDDLVFFCPGINTEILINIIMYLLCILIQRNAISKLSSINKVKTNL